MKWRTAEIYQSTLDDTIWTHHACYKNGICISQFRSDVPWQQRSLKIGKLNLSLLFHVDWHLRQGLNSLWGFVINLPRIYIIDLCFSLHSLFLSYPHLSSRGSLLQRRQATLEQFLYSHYDHRNSVIRFLVFKPPLTRRCLHHFYLFPYPHLLQPFLVFAQRDPWSLGLCHFRLLAHTSHPPSPSMQGNPRTFWDIWSCVRVGPNKVVFRDVSTMQNVYSVHKFDKSTFYKSLLTYVTSVFYISLKLLTNFVLLSYSNDNDHTWVK